MRESRMLRESLLTSFPWAVFIWALMVLPLAADGSVMTFGRLAQLDVTLVFPGLEEELKDEGHTLLAEDFVRLSVDDHVDSAAGCPLRRRRLPQTSH